MGWKAVRPADGWGLDHGVAAVFDPGTNVLNAVRAVLDIMQGRLRNQ